MFYIDVICAMKMSLPSLAASNRLLTKSGGFSLVEVTMALGIVSFAFVTIVALMGTGLNTFHQAMAGSVSSQIFQQVVNSAQQTDFSNLKTTLDKTSSYFDDQGDSLSGSSGSVYQTYITVTTNTKLPGMTAGNPNLCTIEVQLASNPGHLVITDWLNPPSGVTVVTYSTYIANGN